MRISTAVVLLGGVVLVAGLNDSAVAGSWGKDANGRPMYCEWWTIPVIWHESGTVSGSSSNKDLSAMMQDVDRQQKLCGRIPGCTLQVGAPRCDESMTSGKQDTSQQGQPGDDQDRQRSAWQKAIAGAQAAINYWTDRVGRLAPAPGPAGVSSVGAENAVAAQTIQQNISVLQRLINQTQNGITPALINQITQAVNGLNQAGSQLSPMTASSGNSGSSPSTAGNVDAKTAMQNADNAAKRGDTAAAIQWTQRALSQLPPDSQDAADAEENMGNMYKGQGNLRQAEYWYQQAIADGNTHALTKLSEIQQQLPQSSPRPQQVARPKPVTPSPRPQQVAQPQLVAPPTPQAVNSGGSSAADDDAKAEARRIANSVGNSMISDPAAQQIYQQAIENGLNGAF